MSSEQKYNKKTVRISIYLILGIVLAFALLFIIQSTKAISDQYQDNTKFFDSVVDTLDNHASEVDRLKKNTHKLNWAVVKNIAEVYGNSINSIIEEESKSASIRQFQDTVSNVSAEVLLAVKEDGEVVLTDNEKKIGRNLINDGLLTTDEWDIVKGSDAYDTSETGDIIISDVEPYYKVFSNGSRYYFYCVPLYNARNHFTGTYMLMADDLTDLDSAYEAMSSLGRWLTEATAGDEGIAFALDSDKKTFIFGEDGEEEFTHRPIEESGLSEEACENGYAGFEKINGIIYYCNSRAYASSTYGADTVLVRAVPIFKLFKKVLINSTWGTIFIAVTAFIVLFYGVYLKLDRSKKNSDSFEKILKLKKREIHWDSYVARNMSAFALIGLIVIFGISAYSQSLILISDFISEADELQTDVEKRLELNTSNAEEIGMYYNSQNYVKAQLIASIIQRNPKQYLSYDKLSDYVHVYTETDEHGDRKQICDEYGNPIYSIAYSEPLQQLCDENDITSVYIYDDSGRTIATNHFDWYFELSNDETDQSYPFRQVLDEKVPYLIQDAMMSDSGEFSQFVGVAFRYYTSTDSYGNTIFVTQDEFANQDKSTYRGNPVDEHRTLIQVSLKRENEAEMLESTTLEYMLSNSGVGDNRFFLGFDDTEEHKVIYSPVAASIGKTAEDIGVGEEAFSGSYVGFQIINGIPYFQRYAYYDGCYVATTMSKDDLYNGRFVIPTITVLIAALILTWTVLFVSLSTENIDHVLKTTVTQEKKLARHRIRHKDFANATPEKKVAILVENILLIVAAIYVCVYSFAGPHMSSDTAITYIRNDDWEKGLNIFAVTRCLYLTSAALIAIRLLSFVKIYFSKHFDKRVETITHLSLSFIKCFIIMGTAFYSLYLIGFNASSLLTSAGILTAVVGFGAQNLTADILAGIFIVFEGSFHVGDRVTVDNFYGEVIEIGIRTTKIEDDKQNIEIVNNSKITSLLNMSKKSTVFYPEYPICYEESLEKVEEIIKKELPNICDRISGLSALEYLGVQNLSENSVDLKFKARCNEKDRLRVSRAITREIYMTYVENGIEVPYPQVTVHNNNE